MSKAWLYLLTFSRKRHIRQIKPMFLLLPSLLPFLVTKRSRILEKKVNKTEVSKTVFSHCNPFRTFWETTSCESVWQKKQPRQPFWRKKTLPSSPTQYKFKFVTKYVIFYRQSQPNYDCRSSVLRRVLKSNVIFFDPHNSRDLISFPDLLWAKPTARSGKIRFALRDHLSGMWQGRHVRMPNINSEQ